MSIADRMKASETSVRAMAARLDAIERQLSKARDVILEARIAALEQQLARLTAALLEDDEPAPEGKALDGTPIGGERDETMPL